LRLSLRFMKSRETSGTSGFTLVELLMTMALLLILGASAVPLYGNLYTESQVDEVADLMVQMLRTTRVRSQAGLDDATHGFYVDARSYVLYEVSAGVTPIEYSNRNASFDFVVSMPSAITLSTSIPTGDLIFTRPRGIPSIAATETITITHESGARRDIEINSFGIISLR